MEQMNTIIQRLLQYSLVAALPSSSLSLPPQAKLARHDLSLCCRLALLCRNLPSSPRNQPGLGSFGAILLQWQQFLNIEPAKGVFSSDPGLA
jgi:hypothetical protein